MTPPRVYKPFLKNVSRSGKIRRGKCESAPGQGEHMPRGRGREGEGRGDEGEGTRARGRGRGDEGEHKASPLLWTASHAGVYMVERNVAFRSPGHFTLCVVCQQSLIKEQI